MYTYTYISYIYIYISTCLHISISTYIHRFIYDYLKDDHYIYMCTYMHVYIYDYLNEDHCKCDAGEAPKGGLGGSSRRVRPYQPVPRDRLLASSNWGLGKISNKTGHLTKDLDPVRILVGCREL